MNLSAPQPGANSLARACAEIGPTPFCGDLGDVCSDAASPPLDVFVERSVPIEGISPPLPSRPAVARSAEEMAPSCWHERSIRDPSLVEHSEETAYLARLNDVQLALHLGYVHKHKHRGLSDADMAAQDEWRARAIGFSYLYGRDRKPQAQEWLIADLRELGIRSAVANSVVALLELAVVKGLNGICLSAPDFRVLYGVAPSSFWYAVGILEDEGVLERIGMVKPNQGPAPAHTDSNCYVPGTWLRERIPAILGVHDRHTEEFKGEANQARAINRNRMRARRRTHNAKVRDRNRDRLHGLDPLVLTTAHIEELVDRMSDAVLETHQRCVDERVQAFMRGEGIGLGESFLERVEPLLTLEAQLAFERSIEHHLVRLNAGLVDAALAMELPSELRTTLPINQKESFPLDPALTFGGHPERQPPTQQPAVRSPELTTSQPFPTSPAPHVLAHAEQVALESEGLGVRTAHVVNPPSFLSTEHRALGPPDRARTPNTKAQAPPPGPQVRGPAKVLTDEELSALFAKVTSGEASSGWSRGLF